MPDLPAYIDGDYTTPVPIAQTPYEYPFAALGDVTTKLYTRTYVVDGLGYTPMTPGTVDPDLAGHYLITESPLDWTRGPRATLRRTFASIPTPQVEYSTIAINKPPFPEADFEGYWVDNTTSEGTVNVWGIAIARSNVAAYPTGGTFTYTYKSSTTAALNVTDSNATIKAAIDALADMVTDGRTSTITNTLTTNGQLVVAMSGSAFNFGTDTAWNTAGMTPTVVNETATSVGFSGNYYAARAAILYTFPSHGFTGTFDAMLLNGTTGSGLEITATVVDANTLTVPNTDASSPTTYSHLRAFVRTYTPGPDRIRTRLTTTYYLPGVSMGITTPADIPIPDVATNDTTLLLLICENATGFETYDAESLTRWLDRPIYQQTLIATDMANF